MKLLLSIVMPTITARREIFARCYSRYRETLAQEEVKHRTQFLILTDYATCGLAWNDGIAQAEGEYIHLTADDIEPLDGWLLPAIEAVKRGDLPAARILNPDGTLQSCGTDHREAPEGAVAEVARIPFASRAQLDAIGPMLEEHYMGDYWFSQRGRECGFHSRVVRNYAFIHHFAPEGRKRTLKRDIKAYRAKGGRGL